MLSNVSQCDVKTQHSIDNFQHKRTTQTTQTFYEPLVKELISIAVIGDNICFCEITIEFLSSPALAMSSAYSWVQMSGRKLM